MDFHITADGGARGWETATQPNAMPCAARKSCAKFGASTTRRMRVCAPDVEWFFGWANRSSKTARLVVSV